VSQPQGTLARALRFVTEALAPLEQDLGGADKALGLLKTLGVNAPIVPPSLLAVAPSISSLGAKLTAFEAAATADETSAATVAALLDLASAAAAAFQAISALPAKLQADLAAYPDLLAAVDLGALARRLADYLLIQNVLLHAPAIYNLLLAVGVFQVDPVEDSGDFIPPYVEYAIRGDRLRNLAKDPAVVAADVYGWATADFDAVPLLERLEYLLFSAGLTSDLYAPDDDDGSAVPGLPVTPVGHELRVPLFADASDGAAVSLALGLAAIAPPVAGCGVAIRPIAVGALSESFDLGRGVSLTLKADGDLTAPLALTIEAPGGLALQTGGGSVVTNVAAQLSWQPEDGSRLQVLHEPDWLTIDVAGFEAGLTVTDSGGTVSLGLEAGVLDAALTVTPAAADAFVQEVFPANGISSHFAFAVTWSPGAGVAFKGSRGLAVTIPVHASVAGVISVNTLYVQLDIESGPAMTLVIAASAGVELGPCSAVIDKIGVRIPVTFPPGGGNLGRADAEIEFKPPDGVGLAIDAGPVSGGGFLSNDPATGRYAGALELRMESLALKAIGLLDTRLPDGSAGYSLIVIITAEFEAIQLGFGFTLTGVGGLAGINRTVVIDALRAGVRAHRLDNILFPPDPIGQAGQILSDMAAIFPPDSGNYVFGPMVKLGWGTPEVLTLELGLLLELPPPLRLIVLGRIALNLPDPDEPLVRIQMDSLGVVDFGTGQVAVDAVLFDSNIAGFALTGSMALRAAWLGQPGFALAIGGFNPGFTPPAQFPALDRVTIALASGNNPRLRLSAYLALTSNTAQIGARLDLFVQGPFGITLQGELSFDALFQFSPFQFVVGIGGSVTIMSNGQPLLSAAVQVTLTGPNGWHVQGQASFSLFGFSVSVSFDTTIGSAQPLPAPPPVQLAPLLEAALTDQANWAAALPADASTLLTFSAAPVVGKAPAHPLAGLAVHQRVLPLDIAIQRYGSATAADPGSFSITSVTIGTAQAAALSTLDDWFAPGQFLQLSDADSLQRPSFEQLHAGVAVTTPPIAADTAPPPAVPAQYRTMVYDTLGGPPREVVLPGPASTPAVAALTPALTSGRSAATAAAPVVATAQGSPAASRGRARFLAPGLPLQLIGPRYALAATATLAAVGAMPPPGASSSWTATAQNLARYLAASPGQAGQVQLVAGYEVR